MAELGLPGLLQSALGLPRRVARACGRPPAAAGPRSASPIRGRGPQRILRSAFRSRAGAALAGLLLVGLAGPAVAQAQFLSSRIWPARDYTRLTLESPTEIKFTLFSVKDPER